MPATGSRVSGEDMQNRKPKINRKENVQTSRSDYESQQAKQGNRSNQHIFSKRNSKERMYIIQLVTTKIVIVIILFVLIKLSITIIKGEKSKSRVNLERLIGKLGETNAFSSRCRGSASRSSRSLQTALHAGNRVHWEVYDYEWKTCPC